MNLDSAQLQRLSFGGTVCLPPTFPSPGVIRLSGKDGNGSDIVCIEQCDTPERSVRRYVRLEDVRVVWETPNGSLNSDAPQLTSQAELMGRLQNSEVQIRGLAFVAEDARLLFQFEAGMTAAESQFPTTMETMTAAIAPTRSSSIPCKG